jgi:hypothetical protein
MGTIYSSLYRDIQEILEQRYNTDPIPDTETPTIVHKGNRQPWIDTWRGNFSAPLYVISDDTVLGYANTLEDAKTYIDQMISRNLIGHYLNHVNHLNIERKNFDNSSRIHTVTVYGRDINSLFPHTIRVCQYSIWKSVEVEL